MKDRTQPPSRPAPALALAKSQSTSGHHCSFCGASEREASRLIVAEDVCICSQCVSKAASLLLERKGKIANPQPAMDVGFIYCRFCGREAGEFKEVVAQNNATICNECITVCVGVLLDAEAARNLAYDLGSQNLNGV